VLQMIIAGYILSIYQFMVEERGQLGFGFNEIIECAADDNSRVHSVDLSVHGGRAWSVWFWFYAGPSTWYVVTDSGEH